MRAALVVLVVSLVLVAPASASSSPSSRPSPAQDLGALERVRAARRGADAASVPSAERLAARVARLLLENRALEQYFDSAVTARDLAAELERAARASRDPRRLAELQEALDRDPARVAHALVAPYLVRARLVAAYASDPRQHAGVRRRAEESAAAGLSWPALRAAADTASEWSLAHEGAAADAAALRVPVAEWNRRTLELRARLGRVAESAAGFHVTLLLASDEGLWRLGTATWRKTPFETWWSRVAPSLEPLPLPDPGLDELPAISAAPCAADTWTRLDADVPLARTGHTAVWTGAEMIVWGGLEGAYLQDGLRYDPALDAYTPLSSAGAPTGRWGHTATWTGSEMIVYGGVDFPTSLENGARYDPASDTWTPMQPLTVNTGNRSGHSAIWTGTRLIVWGGVNIALFSPIFYNDGGMWDPATDTWTPLPVASGPTSRAYHTAVWTGSEMIVWGGQTQDAVGTPVFLNTGRRLNPATLQWVPTRVGGAPLARAGHTAVWTGGAAARMVVWGGWQGGVGSPFAFNTGGAYDPVTDLWTPTPTSGAPQGRTGHTAVWDGTRMLVWGGRTSAGPVATGGALTVASGTWSALAPNGAPAARAGHTAVWSGTEMIVFGGTSALDEPLQSGARYDPLLGTWRATAGSDRFLPRARTAHVAAWTGSEMIVWGGMRGADAMSEGVRYDAALDAWAPIASAGEPSPRFDHTAVWTGDELIVWGGESSGGAGLLATGGRYDPALDAWTPTSEDGAPTGRTQHTAVWTGGEMIVWGGLDTSGDRVRSGALYDAAADAWRALPLDGAPTQRSRHAAAWTGSAMIAWGGGTIITPSDTGGVYDKERDTWRAMTTEKAPVARFDALGAWSGRTFVAWGGFGDGGSSLDSGGRYDPVADTWTATSTAPLGARERASAVAVCGDLVLWGGRGDGGDALLPRGGARYDAEADAWSPLDEVHAPGGRVGHRAVTTGTSMIVWGGRQSYAETRTGASWCGCADAPAPRDVAGVAGLRASSGAAARWSWQLRPEAAGYDVVRGALAALRSSGGDFAAATEACVADGHAATSLDEDSSPAPGNGDWLLVRAVNASGSGSYDEPSEGLVGPRDPGLSAAPAACP